MIEKKINFLPVDIEFAVDKNFKVHIFQIRTLSTQKRWKKINHKVLDKELTQQKNFFLKNQFKNQRIWKKSFWADSRLESS